LEVGVVTNGTLIDRFMKELGMCRWVGVSVDAGTSTTYKRIKGRDKFRHVLNNMISLRARWPNLEITYKYLVSPQNAADLEQAAKMARDIGCSHMHVRPAGVPWDRINERSLFNSTECYHAKACVEDIRSRYDGFVVATCDKFSETWGIEHTFSRCRAAGMTCVISANQTVGLCCDRRGDPRLQLCEWTEPAEIPTHWGSEKHLQIMKNIDVADCPRCTYSPHNELYESFIDNDRTCKNFI
jgi:MoaA/NifB/PqqE/SkfB family radical SAM enzyme